MFTKNFNEYFSGDGFVTVSVKNSSIIGTGGTKIADFSNYTYGQCYYHYSPVTFFNRFLTEAYITERNTVNGNSISCDYGICFGDGSVAPTVDDITLSGNYVSGISSSNTTTSIKHIADENGVSSTCLYTITNNTDAPMTIGEIGMFAFFKANSSDGYYYNSKCIPYLIERTALEMPITIPAGGVGQVTYTIRMNYPVG